MNRSIAPIILITILLTGCTVFEQTTVDADTEELLTFSNYIQPQLLRNHLEIIAHDSLEGRGTATPGIRKAADYLSDYYKELQLTPIGDNNTYFQHFDLTTTRIDSLVYTTYQVSKDKTVVVNRSTEKTGITAEYTSVLNGFTPLQGSIVFAGFGIDHPELGFSQLDRDLTENAWVLIFEEPHESLLNDQTGLTDADLDLNNRIDNILKNYGANGVLLISDFITPQYENFIGENTHFSQSYGRLQLAYLDENSDRRYPVDNIKYVSPKMITQILGLDSEEAIADLKESISVNANQFNTSSTSYELHYEPYFPGTLQAKNVVAFFEGGDSELKNEVLVLMAHYDHLGIELDRNGEELIYNGADDNGSGTVALMAIAGALNEAKSEGFLPKRSILLLHVSGEELGLLGSRYYSDHPIIPIEQTIANFNADMIGRSDTDSVERGDFNSVYLIGGEIISSGLDSLVVIANDLTVNLNLDRAYNDLTDRNQFYRRSDHWNFGRLGVPFVFFFTGVHEDYHQPTDTSDKIDYEKYHRVVRLIYASTIQTANTDVRPIMDNEMFINITNQS
ncbi:MAG: M28 family peptidase, partial [Balneolaceae bacterium]